MIAEAEHAPTRLWQEFLSGAREQVSSHVFETMLRPVECTRYDGSTVVLDVRDQFCRDWLNDHYLDFIRENLARSLGHRVTIMWNINPAMRPRPQKSIALVETEACGDSPAKEPRRDTDFVSDHSVPRSVSGRPPKLSPTDESAHSSRATPDRGTLNSRYNFDTFVCGPSNQFAFAACKAVAENPGRSYNPLFIYGGVGLGKTHLLSAIGHKILADNADARVIYISSEQFTNEVINAVLGSRLDAFRGKYRRSCDVILVDDIQLIAGKERTQHEFFHIFNTLYDSQRQIVVTSDKLPHEIPEIEERLRNRFQWGLVADVQPPEIETRVAILRKKAGAENFELTDEVAFFLAKNVRTNVRELEGALVRIMAHASLAGTRVTVDYVRHTLTDILSTRAPEVSIETVQKLVATHYNVRVSDLKGRSRLAVIVRPRQIAMFLCRKHTTSSFPDLGRIFGNKDHSTVMSACDRIEKTLADDGELRLQLEDLEQKLLLM